MNRKRFVLVLILSVVMILGSIQVAAGKTVSEESIPTLLAALPEGAYGSAIGPDGALYITEPAAGRISRVDPWTGDVTTFATGLPISGIPFGGAVDVAFIGDTAYALVTLVGPDVGGSDVVGLYQITGPDSATPVADIGTYNIEYPSESEVVVPSGVLFAMEPYQGGFLVTDGHHNRVLWATPEGEVSEFMAFGNIVPTGLEVWGKKVLMAEAGPIPHNPEDGKIVAFDFYKGFRTIEVASGAPLLVDVEIGSGHMLYGLSQGDFPEGGVPADMALPDTGSLVKANRDGTVSVVVEGLNLPNSMEFIGDSAYVVSLTGDIWQIDYPGGAPYKK